MTDDVISPVLAHIEAHLFEPLSLAELADIAGLSAFHFARLFTAFQGESPIAYVRRRRIAAAARRLAGEPELRLVDLALDTGFESQEAFTRAFKRIFTVTPGEFRRRAHLGPLVLMEETQAMNDEPSIDLVQLEKPERRAAFTIAGVVGRFGNDNKSGIPGLWDRLVPRLPLEGQQGWVTYGACYAFDHEEGTFSYMAGAEVAKDAPVPEEMEKLDVPARTYLVFTQTLDGGPIHPQVQAAMRDIWGRRIKESGHVTTGGPDFEYYPADFDAKKPGSTISYYVPIAD